MILSCNACGAQNFVAEERRAVTAIPPRCWKCGEGLSLERETDSGGPESNSGNSGGNGPGEGRNA